MNNLFLKKHKIGDLVKIKSLAWYNTNKNYNGRVCFIGAPDDFIEDMSSYCGKTFMISSIVLNGYRLNGVDYSWSDFMLEEQDQLEFDF